MKTWFAKSGADGDGPGHCRPRIPSSHPRRDGPAPSAGPRRCRCPGRAALAPPSCTSRVGPATCLTPMHGAPPRPGRRGPHRGHRTRARHPEHRRRSARRWAAAPRRRPRRLRPARRHRTGAARGGRGRDAPVPPPRRPGRGDTDRRVHLLPLGRRLSRDAPPHRERSAARHAGHLLRVPPRIDRAQGRRDHVARPAEHGTHRVAGGSVRPDRLARTARAPVDRHAPRPAHRRLVERGAHRDRRLVPRQRLDARRARRGHSRVPDPGHGRPLDGDARVGARRSPGVALRRVPRGRTRTPPGWRERTCGRCAPKVLERIRATDCCTHLNDGLRSLAEVPVLAASLPA